MTAGALGLGLSTLYLKEYARERFAARPPMSDPTLPIVSVFAGRAVNALVRPLVGDARIEHLERPTYICTANLETGRATYHRRGPVADAVLASSAIPGLFPPVELDGSPHVDGGVIDNLPVGPMINAGEGPTIGINVTPSYSLEQSLTGDDAGPIWRQVLPVVARPWTAPGQLSTLLTGGSRALGAVVPYEAVYRAGKSLRVFETNAEHLPNFLQTLLRSLALAGESAVASARTQVDVLIEPELSGLHPLDFKEFDRMYQAGYRAAAVAAERFATALT